MLGRGLKYQGFESMNVLGETNLAVDPSTFAPFFGGAGRWAIDYTRGPRLNP